MKKQFLKSALIAVAGVGLMAGGAMADFINGEIGFTGTANITSTTIDFAPTSPSDPLVYSIVASGSGDFGSIPLFTPVLISDITYSPTLVYSPIMWTFTSGLNTYSFTATSASVTTSGSIHIVAQGFLSATGFDDTLGTWDFTTQTSGSGVRMTWSSNSSPVPEPTTMLLFGTGLVGLAAVGRRRTAITA